ncbi:MAG: coproporphyrinogen dehydrogenase HemZ [Clostridiales bacterium]|nr:coproporphyrinogen dehydrogenase HemZ [Clostridiales bacterium]
MYDIQTVTQIFFPNEGFIKVDSPVLSGLTCESSLNGQACEGKLHKDGVLAQKFSFPVSDDIHETRRRLMISVFLACKAYTGLKTPWGALAGIRPSKMARLLLSQGLNSQEIVERYKSGYCASEEKIRLALDVALAEEKILKLQSSNGFSLYIGIPFCPSRCLYCSFTSYPIGANAGRVDAYLDALEKELDAVKSLSKGRRLDSLYIGGGTPTSLDEEQLERLLEGVSSRFDLRAAKEYSVEAGRPDTLTPAKLEILKRHGVGRISINPQTMNEKTLEIIGRGHTAQHMKAAFAMARDAGFCNINADLILGLPGEALVDVAKTFERIKELKPESITVHTLAVKRASKLRETLEEHKLASAEALEEMLAVAQTASREMGMSAYYMYRQKNMLGNFENVGYCLPGRESLYNVFIMEETQTVWAAGAGAVTKLVEKPGLIERAFNVKSLDDYINRIDEMIKRKEDKFYAQASPKT